VEDSDQCIESLEEVMCEANHGEVYEFDAAKRLPTQYVIKEEVSDKDDWEVRDATTDEIAFHKAKKKRLREESKRKFEEMVKSRKAAR
jgi:hypothetical protein